MFLCLIHRNQYEGEINPSSAGKAIGFGLFKNEHYLTKDEFMFDFYKEKIGPVVFPICDMFKTGANVDCTKRAQGSQGVFKITAEMWSELEKDEATMKMLDFWRSKYGHELYKSDKQNIRGIAIHQPFVNAIFAGAKTEEYRSTRIIKTYDGPMPPVNQIICRWCCPNVQISENDKKLQFCTGH